MGVHYQVSHPGTLIYLTPSYAREAKKKARGSQGRSLAREQATSPTVDVGYGPQLNANQQPFNGICTPAGYVQITIMILR